MTTRAVQLTPIDPDAEWRQTVYYQDTQTRTATDLSATTVTGYVYKDDTLLLTLSGTVGASATIPVPYGAASKGTGTPVSFVITQAQMSANAAYLSGHWQIKVVRTSGGVQLGPDVYGAMKVMEAAPS